MFWGKLPVSNHVFAWYKWNEVFISVQMLCTDINTVFNELIDLILYVTGFHIVVAVLKLGEFMLTLS